MIHKMPTVGIGGGSAPSNYEVASYIKTDVNTQAKKNNSNSS